MDSSTDFTKAQRVIRQDQTQPILWAGPPWTPKGLPITIGDQWGNKTIIFIHFYYFYPYMGSPNLPFNLFNESILDFYNDHYLFYNR